MAPKVSRRNFLLWAGYSTATLLAGCGQGTDQSALQSSPTSTTLPAATLTPIPPTPTPPPAAIPTQFREAPMLAELVRAGKLPPVAERLPATPVVVPVVEQIGRYGGTLRTGVIGQDVGGYNRLARYEGMLRWDPEWRTVLPNLVTEWDVDRSGSEYRLALRRGVRWSDGTPFTAADVMFRFDHIVGHRDFKSKQPDWMIINTVPAVVTALDDYTISFKFGGPHGLFLQYLASSNGLLLTEIPAHYAKQWHIDFNSAVAEQARELKIDDWKTLFWSKVSEVNGRTGWSMPETPTLSAWIPKNLPWESNPWLVERNPFYWKVDESGNQLPYIDQIAFEQVETSDALIDKATRGEWHMIDRNISTPALKPRILEQRAAGKYDTYDLIPAQMNLCIIALNLTSADPNKRSFFGERKVRQALSVAIERQRIIEEVYNGLGVPAQAAPRPESDLYDEEMTTQFTAYFPEQADAWLDEAGYPRGADGNRRYPDGTPIRIQIEAVAGAYADAGKIIAEDWRAHGLDIVLQEHARADFDAVVYKSKHDVALWEGGGGLDPYFFPYWFVPLGPPSMHMQAWGMWQINPNDPLAEEPPPAILQLNQSFEDLRESIDPLEQSRHMRAILERNKAELYVLGVALPVESVGIKRPDIRNVPDEMFNSFVYLNPGPTNPAQYYLDM